MSNINNGVDYLGMTQKELIDFGFRFWNKSGLMLIPISIFKEVLASLPEGTELTSINRKVGIVGKDTFDDDSRYGLTAWGWTPK